VKSRVVPESWQGAHWALAALADLGYPPGDTALYPLREQVFGTWLDESYHLEFEATTKSSAYRRRGVPVMRGRYRRCASQQGNALRFLIALGLADSRCDALVERLLHWQWPDGGWNWGGTSTRRANPWVTADALAVLRAAGRLQL
jgi:hypothetical protein